MNEKILSMLMKEKVITLSTSKNGPWSSPVYYVFYDKAFWFFSSGKSKHSPEKGKRLPSGAAVFEASDSWQRIRGIQMSGYIEESCSKLAGAKAFSAYLKKFPLLKDFFKDKKTFDLGDIMILFRVSFYRFVPEYAEYSDNAAGFGKKEKVDLNRKV